MNGSAVLNVSASKTGSPWLNLPIAENTSKQSTSPPARRPSFLRTQEARISETGSKTNVPRRNGQRNVRVGDELGFGVGVPGLLNLDDALEGHPVVGEAADDDGFLGRGGRGTGGALARGSRGLRGAARRVGSGSRERETAAREAGVAGEERIGVGGGCGRARRLGRQPPRGEGAVRGLAHEQHLRVSR